MSQGVSVPGVSVRGVSVRGVYVLGVSVRGVHVRGGYVLEPRIEVQSSYIKRMGCVSKYHLIIPCPNMQRMFCEHNVTFLCL